MVYYSDTNKQIGQVAGAIHLNKLPVDQVPAIEELINSFSGRAADGIPLQLGRDEFDTEIYTLHFGKARGLGLQTVCFILSAHSNPLDWKFFNVRVTMHYFAKISAFIFHQLKLDKLESIIVAHEIQRSYRDIAALVRQTKELSKNHD